MQIQIKTVRPEPPSSLTTRLTTGANPSERTQLALRTALYPAAGV